jgi:hypothetical protein
VLAFLKGGLAALIGIALGLAVTFVTLERGFGFGAVQAGPWTAWPRVGASDIDPYARAVLSRTGEIPLAAAQGIAFYVRLRYFGCRSCVAVLDAHPHRSERQTA